MNPGGHYETLTPAEPGNVLALKHGVYARGTVLSPAGRELVSDLLALPHMIGG